MNLRYQMGDTCSQPPLDWTETDFFSCVMRVSRNKRRLKVFTSKPAIRFPHFRHRSFLRSRFINTGRISSPLAPMCSLVFLDSTDTTLNVCNKRFRDATTLLPWAWSWRPILISEPVFGPPRLNFRFRDAMLVSNVSTRSVEDPTTVVCL